MEPSSKNFTHYKLEYLLNMFKPILLIILVSIIPTFAKTTQKPKCDQKVCYLFFKPVCARNSDGKEKTFTNSCFLSIDCSDPRKFHSTINKKN